MMEREMKLKSVICILLFSVSSFAQGGDSDYLSLAKKFFEAKEYHDAYEYYRKYSVAASLKSSDLVNFASAAHESGRQNECIRIIESYATASKKMPVELYRLQAQAYQSLGNPIEAANNYKLYLDQPKLAIEKQRIVFDKLKNCAYLNDNSTQVSDAIIQNLGAEINGVYDERRPLFSSNYDEVMYFSAVKNNNVGGRRTDDGVENSKGSYKADIFNTEILNGLWQTPVRLSSLVNTPKTDIPIGFGNKGRSLFYFSSLNGCGHILKDTYVDNLEDKPLFPEKFEGPVFSENCDIDAQFIDDGNLILFASQTLPGFGGYDLFVVQKSDTGWTEPVNLGAKINSEYDEKSPFLANDGRSLYFSSNNPKMSYGGFDLFLANFDEKSKAFSTPKNLGLGINSVADDIDITINKAYSIMYFASNRKSGYGGFDLYAGYLKNEVSGKNRSVIPYFTSLMAFDDEDAVVDVDKEEDKEGLLKISTTQHVLINSKLPISFGKNAQILEEWADYLVQQSSLNIGLYGFNNKKSPNFVVDLFSSVDFSQQVKSFLLAKGVREEQIFIFGAGTKHPMTEPNHVLAEKLNNRVEAFFFDKLENPIIEYKLSQESQRLEGLNAGAIFRKLATGLTYRIELVQTSQVWNEPILSTESDVLLEKLSNNSFSYTIGTFKKLSDAQKRLAKFQEKFTTAKIFPYWNGVRLDKPTLELKAQEDSSLNYFVD